MVAGVTTPTAPPPRWWARPPWWNVFARLSHLEHRMSLTDAALADLDDATNVIAAELEDLRDDVAEFDTALATRIGEKASRLRQLAADPEQPVPPAPVPAEAAPQPLPETQTGPDASLPPAESNQS